MANIKGKWVLKNPVSVYTADERLIQKVTFTIGGQIDYTTAFSEIQLVKSSGYGGSVYFNGGIMVCDAGGNWRNDRYVDWDGTMDFGDEPQGVSDDFYAWFTANATLAIAVNIAYKGVTTYIPNTKTATLTCGGKKSLTNISMTFISPGSITYGNDTKYIAAGQTATLPCAGKKMKSNVVVSV